jgi:transposase-like protein
VGSPHSDYRSYNRSTTHTFGQRVKKEEQEGPRMKKEKPMKCPHCHKNTVESITGKTQSTVMVHWENPKQPVVLQWAVSHFKCANCEYKPTFTELFPEQQKEKTKTLKRQGKRRPFF